MATVLRDEPPDMVVIEQVVAPSGAQGHTNYDTTMITIGMFGILTGIVRCKSIRLEIAPISTWKKHFIGKGRLTHIENRHQRRKEGKRLVIERCQILGWSPEDDNQADAAGIWDWAGATFMGRIPEALHLFGEKKRA